MELKHWSKPSTGSFQSAGIYRTKGCQNYKRVLSDQQTADRGTGYRKVSTAYYQVFSQQQKLEAVESSYESTLKARNIIKVF